jgi:MFS transporter, SHS family, lactate transporter
MNKPQAWWREPTRKQWAAFSAAWAGWVLDAFDFTIYIVVAHEIMKEFDVPAVAVHGSLTLTLLVRLAGGSFAGWMADRWGRRLPLMLSLVWFATFDALIFFAPTFTWIVVFRTLFGFGMGAEWTAGTALAMESFPVRSRKIASGLLQAGWPVGFLLAAATAYFVVPAWGWRPMFLIAAVPALLVIPIRMFVPNDIAQPETKEVSRGAIKDLLAPGVFKMIVLGSLVMTLGFIVYYGMSVPLKGLSLAAGMSSQDANLILIWFNVGMLFGVLAAGWIANRFGVVVALVTPALLMVPALPLFVGLVPSLLPLGAFLGGCLGVGYSGVTPVLTTSLFPAHVRARAIGLVYHIGALFAAFIPTLIPWLVMRTDMTLATTVMIVVGSGLTLMATAVLVLRKMISLRMEQVTADPPATSPSPSANTAFDVDTSPVSTPNIRRAPSSAASSSSSSSSSPASSPTQSSAPSPAS